jgi:hypothetical protein
MTTWIKTRQCKPTYIYGHSSPSTTTSHPFSIVASVCFPWFYNAVWLPLPEPVLHKLWRVKCILAASALCHALLVLLFSNSMLSFMWPLAIQNSAVPRQTSLVKICVHLSFPFLSSPQVKIIAGFWKLLFVFWCAFPLGREICEDSK